MKIKLIFIVAVINLIICCAYADTKEKTLSKNPFSKPMHNKQLEEENNVVNDIGGILTDRNLRATLTSSKRSIANIDGMMIFVGEKVKGYTLVSVDEGSATFVKNGEEVKLNVNEIHKSLRK